MTTNSSPLRWVWTVAGNQCMLRYLILFLEIV